MKCARGRCQSPARPGSRYCLDRCRVAAAGEARRERERTGAPPKPRLKPKRRPGVLRKGKRAGPFVLLETPAYGSPGRLKLRVRCVSCNEESLIARHTLWALRLKAADGCRRCRWKRNVAETFCVHCETPISRPTFRGTSGGSCAKCQRIRDGARKFARRLQVTGRVCRTCERTDADVAFNTLTECTACNRSLRVSA